MYKGAILILCLTSASFVETSCFKIRLIIIDEMVIKRHPTIQQLSDSMVLFVKFSFKSFRPFFISFLNNKIKITTYIKSLKKKQNILGFLGILLMLIPNEFTKDSIKLL